MRAFFGALPNTVAGRPEGQEAIKTVIQMLEQLDQAARSEQGTAASASGGSLQQPPAPDGEEDMEIDDESLTQMADAAVEEAGDDSEEALAARQAKVAETKYRLAKVRKVHKKKGPAQQQSE